MDGFILCFVGEQVQTQDYNPLQLFKSKLWPVSRAALILVQLAQLYL